jgi:malate permease and related proteins
MSNPIYPGRGPFTVSNLYLVFICLLLGLLFQRVKQFPENSAAVLNTYVIYVALPALVLYEIPKLELDHRAFILVAIAWLVMIFSAVMTLIIARLLHWSKPVTGGLLLVITLGNTGFVGFPLIEAHLGRDAVPYAILYDQFGTFIALNTLGIAIASIYSGKNNSLKSIGLNILKFPPFIALCLAFALRFFEYPESLSEVLHRLAATLVPVVMIAVGLQWKLRLQRENLSPMLIALVLILFIEPSFAWMLTYSFGLDGLIAHSIVLEAAMPAMISAGVLATAYNLAPQLSSSIVGYSLMLSLGSLFLWKFLIT